MKRVLLYNYNTRFIFGHIKEVSITINSRSQYMKKKRERWKGEHRCTRCGGKVNGGSTCIKCKEYLSKYRIKKKGDFKSIRKLKKIENEELYKKCIDEHISIKKLSNDLDVSARSVLRWITSTTIPSEINQKKLQKYFEKTFY